MFRILKQTTTQQFTFLPCSLGSSKTPEKTFTASSVPKQVIEWNDLERRQTYFIGTWERCGAGTSYVNRACLVGVRACDGRGFLDPMWLPCPSYPPNLSICYIH